MRSLPISKFKAHALALVKAIAETGESVIVTKRGEPLVVVSPYKETERGPAPGALAGTIAFEEDIVSPLGPEAHEAARKGADA